MEEHRPSKRFRGYRPPSRRWDLFKTQLAIVILGLGVLGISIVLTNAVWTGEIPVPRKSSSEIVTWAASPGRFIKLFVVWALVELMCGFGMHLLATRVKELRTP